MQSNEIYASIHEVIPFQISPYMPKAVGISNTTAVRKPGASKPTRGPGGKSYLSRTLSYVSFYFGSFVGTEFWVWRQKETFKFRSHTQKLLLHQASVLLIPQFVSVTVAERSCPV